MEGRLRRRRDRQAGRQLPSSQCSFQDGAGQEHREVSPGGQNAGAAWPTLTGPALWSTAGPSRGGGTLSGASLPGQLPRGGRASCLFHKQPAALGPGRGAGEEGSLQPQPRGWEEREHWQRPHARPPRLHPQLSGSCLSELLGAHKHARLSCFSAFTLAVSAPRKAFSVTLQSPTQRPLVVEASLDFHFPKAPPPPTPSQCWSSHGSHSPARQTSPEIWDVSDCIS